MNINKYWDSTRDDIVSNREYVLFLDEHLNYLDGCERIIDLGCGTGNLVKKLKSNNKAAYGITYSEDEFNQAITEGVIVGDMHEIPFNDDTFDAFVMWDSLEHCQSAYIALCEAKRVIRENGKGLIFMPGQNWLNYPAHICCYTIAQMEQLFRQSGLKLVNVFPKEYPNGRWACDEMAVYEVVKDSSYRPVFNETRGAIFHAKNKK